MTGRRAVRPAGTVGGDEANLRHVLPSSQVPAPPAPALPGAAPPGPAGAVPSRDETAEGWSEPPDDPDRLAAERPPHWA